MAVVNGTVSMSVTKERVPRATVEARKDEDTKRTAADDLGAFTIADLDDGSWSFVALDGENVPGRTKTLKVPDHGCFFVPAGYHPLATVELNHEYGGKDPIRDQLEPVLPGPERLW